VSIHHIPFRLALRRAILAGLLIATPAFAGADPAKQTAKPSIEFSANELTYDKDRQVYTASGHVKMRRQGVRLYASTVTYDQRAGTVTARGAVRLIDRRGSVLHANVLELSDDLKNGFIEGVRIRFSDGSRLAARAGKRQNGTRNSLDHAVYSPCPVCDDEENDTPLWRIKAMRVIHDEKTHTIKYKNAVLEFFGVPVAYTPYLSHGDPTVKRRSGLLTPSVGQSNELGLRAEIPYFINLAPNRDLTVTPMLTSRGGPVGQAEYRERTRSGKYDFSGSLAYVSKRDDAGAKIAGNEFRGHLFGNGRFSLADNADWGFKVATASDDTYLRRYSLSKLDTLTNRLFVEGFSGRSSFEANAYAFQGLRQEDISGQTPIVFPSVELHYVGTPAANGSRIALDFSLLALTRTAGIDSRRLSTGGSWRLPLVTRSGQLITLTAGARADVYYTSDLPDLANLSATPGSQVELRTIPYVMVDWRFPFARPGATVDQTLEPIISLVASPNSNRTPPAAIVNEDSQSFDFDEISLFGLNRFAGLDRWDGGARINYGLNYGLSTAGSFSADFFIGQSYRFTNGSPFPTLSGLDRNLSDIITRAKVAWGAYVDFYNRLRLDKKTLSVRRHETTLMVGPEAVKIIASYLEVTRESFDPALGPRREVNGQARLRLNRNWSTRLFATRDLRDSEWRRIGTDLIYENECLRFVTNFRKDFTNDRGVAPGTSVSFHVVFKHVGS